jgi:hypothetical protein
MLRLQEVTRRSCSLSRQPDGRRARAELMKCDDEKQCQILGNVPSNRRVTASGRTDFKRGYEKPRPVHKDINSS